MDLLLKLHLCEWRVIVGGRLAKNLLQHNGLPDAACPQHGWHGGGFYTQAPTPTSVSVAVREGRWDLLADNRPEKFGFVLP